MSRILKIILLLITLFIYQTSALADKIRIMPLGDSITWGYPTGPGYRGYLWHRMKDAGYDIDFVGSRYDGSGFDAAHEGYGYWKTHDTAESVYGFLQDNFAHIILLHIGSNDVSPTQGTNSSSISGLRNILNEIDRYEQNYNRTVYVILATIINRSTYHQTLVDYNNNLRSLYYSRKSNGDKIVLVNMENKLSGSNFADSVHPNSSGYRKMSTIWYNKLNDLLFDPVPSKPTEVSASSVSAYSATLRWNDTSNNESGFKIYRNGIRIKTLGSNASSYTLNGLEPETSYTYEVVSYNSEGASSAATISFTTLPQPTPSKPLNLTVGSIQINSAILSWEDTSFNEAGFKIYKNGEYVASISANTSSYTISNLESRSSYVYSIRSFNSSGNSSALSVSFTTKDDYAWLIPVNHIILF